MINGRLASCLEIDLKELCFDVLNTKMGFRVQEDGFADREETIVIRTILCC